MNYRAKKLLCCTAITAIINSSFQPIYAGTLISEELAVQEHHQPRLLALDNYLQEKVNVSASFIQDWTPAFIKHPLFAAYEQACSWLEATVKDVAPVISAKTPFEIDYAHDLNYWQAHFTNEIEELKSTEFNPERLIELQGIVWSGLLSPYQYEQGLKELKGNISKSQLKKISKRFKEELKSAPELLRQNVQRDLVASLGDIHGAEKGLEAFKELLAYYQPLQNALDNTESLVEFTRFIQKNRDALKLSNQQYKALNEAISKSINQRDPEAYRELRKQRQLTQSALQELSYYNGDIFEDVFNSALPPAIKKAGAKESISFLKGLTRLAYQGIEYAATHPIQAITISLASQVAAAAALSTFKSPEIKHNPLDDGDSTQAPKEQTTTGGSSLFHKKSIPEQPFLSPRYSKRTIGDEFQINQNTTDSQYAASVASLTNGNAFVIWQGYQTGNLDSYGRIFSADGMALTNEFTINQNTTSSQYATSVASLTNGNAFVAWTGNQTGNLDIYGRVFFPNGTAINDEFTINQNRTLNQNAPSIARLTNGNAFIAWQGSQTGNNDIYARVFFPNGTALNDEFTINQNTTSSLKLSVTGLTNGNAFVTWDSSTGGFHIYGRIFSADGMALSNEILINQNTTSGQQYTPSVASLTNGNAFVAWYEIGDFGIYGRLFLPNGTALTNEFPINQNTTSFQGFPSVASLTNGNAFVAWQSDQPNNIYGRIFSENGTVLINKFPINQNTTSSMGTTSVTSLTNGNAFVTWAVYQAGNNDIYGRIFTNDTLNSLISPFTTGLLTTVPLTTNPLTTDVLTTNSLTTSPLPATTLADTQTSSPSTSLSTAEIPTTGMNGGITTSPLLATTLADMQTSSPSSSSNLPIIIVGATVGGVTLFGGGCGLAYYLYKKRTKHSSYQPERDEDIELPKRMSTNASPFSPAKIGYTSHPTVVGALRNQTYAIWKNISRKEAELIQPCIAKKLPPIASSTDPVAFALGKGNFGATYVGINISNEGETKELYAVKEVFGRKAVEESQHEGELQNDLKNCSQVMPLVDYRYFEPEGLSDDPRLFQIMPLAYTNGAGYKELLSPLKVKDPSLHEKLVSDNFLQLMKGIAFMHDKSIVHLDIKDDNILYMLDGTLRIGDLGRAKKLDPNEQIADNQLGDRRKFSPEILAFVRSQLKEKGMHTGDGEISKSFTAWAADAWAGGLYILELWLDTDPFSDEVTPYKIKVLNWTNASFEKILAEIKPLQEASSESFAGILRQILAIDVNKRLKPSKAVKKLTSFDISSKERTEAFKVLLELNQTAEVSPNLYSITPAPHLRDGNLYSITPKEKDKNYNLKALDKEEDKDKHENHVE